MLGLEETNKCVDLEDLESLVDVIISANEFGVSWSYHNVTSPSSWDFWSSLFFTTTLLTTIGYGHVTPLGYSSKLFCLFYALVGVPITLLFLTMFMTLLHRLSKLLYKALDERIGKKPIGSARSDTDLPVRSLHICIIVTLFSIFFVILPATVFLYLEPTWTYLDCYYFIFISLTTIGLGDFIPANDYSTEDWDPSYRAIYQTLVSVYLVIGLAVVLLIVELFVTIPQVRSKLNTLYGSDEDDDLAATSVEQQELSQIPYNNAGYSSMDTNEHKISETAELVH
ncbi:potassium channel subfamily K member 1-like isoform X2 [Antedon mediterranea]|uniref:potassium channel subfamily K member 1-like isoform X2 n=1 Tax=Antedon mediterranea TaxID=105859 RepID=UPI003AF411C7